MSQPLPGLGPAVTLRPRQALALNYIAQNAPVRSDELGAWLHADRMQRGGRGHSDGERCDYCNSEGAQMGRALAAKGLVRRRRGEGWVPASWQPPREPSAQLGPDDPWPAGF